MSKTDKKQKAGKAIQHKPAGYDTVLSDVVELLDAARTGEVELPGHRVARAENATLQHQPQYQAAPG